MTGSDLPGLLVEEAGQPVGVLLYHMGAGECEVVALVSRQEGKGAAITLLAEAERVARAARCRRLWLVTTNDNLAAIAFYRKGHASTKAWVFAPAIGQETPRMSSSLCP